MLNTIESAHSKLTEKITTGKKCLEIIKSIMTALKTVLNDTKTKTKNSKQIAINNLESIHINLIIQEMEETESSYELSTINVMSDYYGKPESETRSTTEYYRILTRENYVLIVNGILSRIISIVGTLQSIRMLFKSESSVIGGQLDDIIHHAEYSRKIVISCSLEKKNYEFCKCGVKMNILPELSKLHCPNCSKLKDIIGTVFKDEQMHSHDGQKKVHGDYNTGRHCKFHLMRLQALKPKIFSDIDVANFERVLIQDGYIRSMLNCEQVRIILKKIDSTGLNEYAPLLVKKFGGPAPPLLNFEENRILGIKFNKVMQLYDVINPEGGNKPYYPYFIFKIIENMFAGDKEKLRLLDYIHLQSRDTVIKHDIMFEQICILSDEKDKLAYTPTDPAGRL
jgi:hypothetical protein